MNTVYKYGFEINDDFELELPRGARILHVNVQHDCPCIWALVDPNAPKEMRKFHLAGTGHPIDIDMRTTNYTHVGTFMMHEGKLVFHLFAL
jgi:hypothetical protein